MPLTLSQCPVDVYVVDVPSVAGVALGAPRTDAESTHVLCRHEDEATPDFIRRVLRRIARIQRDRRLRSLSYVVGPEAAREGSAPLLHWLIPQLESGTRLTVVGPDSAGVWRFPLSPGDAAGLTRAERANPSTEPQP